MEVHTDWWRSIQTDEGPYGLMKVHIYGWKSIQIDGAPYRQIEYNTD